jgi:hypothetical protein
VAKDESGARTGKVVDPTCDATAGQSPCATGNLPMKLAPQNNGTEGSKYAIALLAMNFGGLDAASRSPLALSALVRTLDRIDYVPPPDAPVPIAYESYLELPGSSSVSIARSARRIVIANDADPRVQVYRFDVESHAGLTWNIWMGPVGTGRTVTLPDPSVAAPGLADPMADATTEDGNTAGPSARLLGVRLGRHVTAEQLEKFGSLTLDELGSQLTAFTIVEVPVDP